jgi:hypothetical protein
MDEFQNLVTYFKATQERFENATTNEERRALLAISREIIRTAHCLIADSRREIQAWRKSADSGSSAAKWSRMSDWCNRHSHADPNSRFFNPRNRG